GSVFLSPRIGIVERGSSSPEQAPKKQAPPIRHSTWSMCASGWQLPHAKLPLVEANALLKAMRPLRTSSVSRSLGSAILSGDATIAFGFDTSTIEIVFSSELST